MSPAGTPPFLTAHFGGCHTSHARLQSRRLVVSGVLPEAVSPTPSTPPWARTTMADGKNLVGVDIGASSIKVVQLKEARKKLQVVRSGWSPLPAQTIIDGHVMNSGAVTE